jgi:hypothetical protein
MAMTSTFHIQVSENFSRRLPGGFALKTRLATSGGNTVHSWQPLGLFDDLAGIQQT